MSRWRTFLDGMASVFCIWPTPVSRAYRYVAKSDADALRGDWESVGGDFRSVLPALDEDDASLPD